jgi:hypothetical protein
VEVPGETPPSRVEQSGGPLLAVLGRVLGHDVLRVAAPDLLLAARRAEVLSLSILENKRGKLNE